MVWFWDMNFVDDNMVYQHQRLSIPSYSLPLDLSKL